MSLSERKRSTPFGSPFKTPYKTPFKTSRKSSYKSVLRPVLEEFEREEFRELSCKKRGAHKTKAISLSENFRLMAEMYKAESFLFLIPFMILSGTQQAVSQGFLYKLVELAEEGHSVAEINTKIALAKMTFGFGGIFGGLFLKSRLDHLKPSTMIRANGLLFFAVVALMWIPLTFKVYSFVLVLAPLLQVTGVGFNAIFGTVVSKMYENRVEGFVIFKQFQAGFDAIVLLS